MYMRWIWHSCKSWQSESYMNFVFLSPVGKRFGMRLLLKGMTVFEEGVVSHNWLFSFIAHAICSCCRFASSTLVPWFLSTVPLFLLSNNSQQGSSKLQPIRLLPLLAEAHLLDTLAICFWEGFWLQFLSVCLSPSLISTLMQRPYYCWAQAVSGDPLMSGDLLFSVMSGSPLTAVFKKTSQLLSEAACYMLLRERRAKRYHGLLKRSLG